MTESPAPVPPPPRPSRGSIRLVTGACVLGLVGIVFSLGHFFWPTPLMFSLFMIVGQGSFGLAMLLYMIAILADLKRQKVL